MAERTGALGKTLEGKCALTARSFSGSLEGREIGQAIPLMTSNYFVQISLEVNFCYFSPRSFSQNFAGLEGNSGPRTAGCWRLSDEDCTGNPVCQAQRAWEALQRAIREVLTPYKKNRARHLVCVPKKRGHVLWTFSEEEKKQFRIVRFRGFAARHARPAESGARGGGQPTIRSACPAFVVGI